MNLCKQSAPWAWSYRFVHKAISFTPVFPAIRRSMGSSHEERTATEPREKNIHKVILQKIETVNENIRLIRLKISNEKHLEARGPTSNCILKTDVHV